VNDSLKYGLPAGIISALLLYINVSIFNQFPLELRWAFDSIYSQLIVLYFLKKSNGVYFPYSFAFFSGFNTLFIIIFVKALLMIVFSDKVIAVSADGFNSSKLIAYNIFRESIGHFVVGLLIVALLSWIMKKKKNRI